jgi:hypothetical protein
MTASSQAAWIPFIVRAAAPGSHSKVLVKISDTTTQAYNMWPGAPSSPNSVSLYEPNNRMPRISFDRPYFQGTDNYEKYQLPFLRWAKANGFELEFCSSLDLHANPRLLDNYRLFLSLGHVRDNVEAFIGYGGNMAFFSGNACWWQVRFDNNNRTMVCYKSDENESPHDPFIETDPSLAVPPSIGLIPSSIGRRT